MKIQPLWKANIHGHTVIHSVRMEKSKRFPWAKCGLSSCWCAELSYPGTGKEKTFKEAAVVQPLPRAERQRSISAPHFDKIYSQKEENRGKYQFCSREGQPASPSPRAESQPPTGVTHLTTVHDRQHCCFLLLPAQSLIQLHTLLCLVARKTPCVSNISANEAHAPQHWTLLETLRVFFYSLGMNKPLGDAFFDVGVGFALFWCRISSCFPGWPRTESSCLSFLNSETLAYVRASDSMNINFESKGIWLFFYTLLLLYINQPLNFLVGY